MSEQDKPQQTNEFDIWLNWLKQLSVLGRTVVRLFEAELTLAVADFKRLILASLLLLPIALFGWLGFSVFISWLAYALFQAPWLGLLTFLTIQVLTAVWLISLIKQYRRSLSLPVTRKHLRELIKDFENETP